MFNKHDIARDACQLFGAQARKGYDWWWHSFPFQGRKFDSVSFLYVSKMDRPDPMREGHIPCHEKGRFRSGPHVCEMVSGEETAQVQRDIPETVFYHPAAEGSIDDLFRRPFIGLRLLGSRLGDIAVLAPSAGV